MPTTWRRKGWRLPTSEEQQCVVHTYTRQLEAANPELGRANTSLQQALSERQRLTAIVAHEVRNFLQGLK